MIAPMIVMTETSSAQRTASENVAVGANCTGELAPAVGDGARSAPAGKAVGVGVGAGTVIGAATAAAFITVNANRPELGCPSAAAVRQTTVYRPRPSCPATGIATAEASPGDFDAAPRVTGPPAESTS